MTNVYERTPATNLAFPHNPADLTLNRSRWGAPGSALAAPDLIRRIEPPQASEFGGLRGMSGILSQLLAIVQQLLSAIGMGGAFGGLFGNSQTPQPYFESATASSTGDPHLAFNGTASNGGSSQTRFDSMIGHTDLLDSDSFAGGYTISTSVTKPAGNGVTYNRKATIATNFGATQVSLDRNGNATILQNGQTISLANGQSLSLGNGETVTRNADGSLVVRDDNGMGGTIATTLSENGQGVDVNAQATRVDLGGDLVTQPQQASTRLPFPPYVLD
jgi:hypothetical protein